MQVGLSRRKAVPTKLETCKLLWWSRSQPRGGAPGFWFSQSMNSGHLINQISLSASLKSHALRIKMSVMSLLLLLGSSCRFCLIIGVHQRHSLGTPADTYCHQNYRQKAVEAMIRLFPS